MSGLTNTILVVDDNDDDVYALKRALKKANVANPQQIVSHGRAAVDYLAGTGAYSDRVQFPLPFIVFLDLKTPFMDGFEVLTWIRDQTHLSLMAVVILTGSVDEKDDRKAYSLGARACLTKPPTPADLEQLLQTMESYWRRDEDTAPSPH